VDVLLRTGCPREWRCRGRITEVEVAMARLQVRTATLHGTFSGTAQDYQSSLQAWD